MKNKRQIRVEENGAGFCYTSNENIPFLFTVVSARDYNAHFYELIEALVAEVVILKRKMK